VFRQDFRKTCNLYLYCFNAIPSAGAKQFQVLRACNFGSPSGGSRAVCTVILACGCPWSTEQYVQQTLVLSCSRKPDLPLSSLHLWSVSAHRFCAVGVLPIQVYRSAEPLSSVASRGREILCFQRSVRLCLSGCLSSRSGIEIQTLYYA